VILAAWLEFAVGVAVQDVSSGAQVGDSMNWRQQKQRKPGSNCECPSHVGLSRIDTQKCGQVSDIRKSRNGVSGRTLRRTQELREGIERSTC
jgi:hypothetical protein